VCPTGTQRHKKENKLTRLQTGVKKSEIKNPWLTSELTLRVEWMDGWVGVKLDFSPKHYFKFSYFCFQISLLILIFKISKQFLQLIFFQFLEKL
jgi:hypothetical protein